MNRDYDFGLGVSVVINSGSDEYSCNTAEIRNSEIGA